MAASEDEFDFPGAEEYFQPQDEFDLPNPEIYFDPVCDRPPKRRKAGPSVVLRYQDEDEEEKKVTPDLLGIPRELFNLILACLDPLQIFAVQRVCTRFRDAIKEVKNVRSKMLFTPGTIYNKYFVRAELNRLLAPRSKSKLAKALYPCRVECNATRTEVSVTVELRKDWLKEHEESIAGLPFAFRIFAGQSCSKSGSWRDIVISNFNAPLRLTVSTQQHPNDTRSREHTWREPLTGLVTLGKIIDTLGEPTLEFCIQRDREACDFAGAYFGLGSNLHQSI